MDQDLLLSQSSEVLSSHLFAPGLHSVSVVLSGDVEAAKLETVVGLEVDFLLPELVIFEILRSIHHISIVSDTQLRRFPKRGVIFCHLSWRVWLLRWIEILRVLKVERPLEGARLGRSHLPRVRCGDSIQRSQ